MREYIIHYQCFGNDITQEMRVEAGTMQDALNIFRTNYPNFIVMNIEGPYDIR